MNNKKEQEKKYIGAQISEENYWKVKKALAERKENMQVAIIDSLEKRLNIKIKS